MGEFDLGFGCWEEAFLFRIDFLIACVVVGSVLSSSGSVSGVVVFFRSLFNDFGSFFMGYV